MHSQSSDVPGGEALQVPLQGRGLSPASSPRGSPQPSPRGSPQPSPRGQAWGAAAAPSTHTGAVSSAQGTELAHDLMHIPYEQNVVVEQEARFDGGRVAIEHYQHILGVGGAASMYELQRMGVKCRRIRVDMEDTVIRFESGLMHYMFGNIEMDSSLPGLGQMFKAHITNEAKVKPKWQGTGTIYSEPTWKHLALLQLGEGERCVVDKGLYVASEGTVQVGAARQKNFSTGMRGGEGWYQTKMQGPGWAVIEMPVPMREVHKFRVVPGKRLSVDGTFAILRRGQIDFTVHKSSKSFIKTRTAGEGWLQCFEGDGEVWVCPTIHSTAPLSPSWGMQRAVS